MNRKLFILSLLSLLMIWIPSCKEDDTCRTSKYVRMYASFKRLNISDSGDSTVVNLSIDTLSIHGLGIDSILYKSAAINSINLPLNKLADESHFIFNANDTIDTVSIYYTRKEEYLSFECGMLTTFTIDNIKSTKHYIDSIKIQNNIVDTENAENIYIYHNPRR